MNQYYWYPAWQTVSIDNIGIDPCLLCPAKCKDGKKGQCQKICCCKLLKEENRGKVFNNKLQRIRGLKGMCHKKMRRNHTQNFFSFCSDTFPLILVFYAAFYWRICLCFLHFNSSLQQIFWHCPFKPWYLARPIIKEYLLLFPSFRKMCGWNRFLTDGSIPSVECELMDWWSSVEQGFCDWWSILSLKKKKIFNWGVNTICGHHDQ